MMKAIKLEEASIKQLREHYDDTIETRLKFDKIRPSFYEGSKDAMMQHYKKWLSENNIKFIGVNND